MSGVDGRDDWVHPENARAIRDEELQRALRRLDAHEELTQRQRATVERLADRLTENLLAMFAADQTPPDIGDGVEEEAVLVSD